MYGAPLCQRPQQAADQRHTPCGLTPHLCPRCLGMTPPDGRTCRRSVRRGWARHLRWRVPTLTPLPGWFCKAHATCLPTPDDHRSSLHRKAHGLRGSVEGRLRVNMAMLIGCQMSADWHARLRIRVRSALTSWDGTMAEHRVVVQQCGGWWKAAREGGRVLGNGEAGHATCRAVLRGSVGALGITEDFRRRRQEGVAGDVSIQLIF